MTSIGVDRPRCFPAFSIARCALTFKEFGNLTPNERQDLERLTSLDLLPLAIITRATPFSGPVSQSHTYITVSAATNRMSMAPQDGLGNRWTSSLSARPANVVLTPAALP